MPITRARSLADIRRDLLAAEHRAREMYSRWSAEGTVGVVSDAGPTREQAQRIEEILRLQRGAVDRLHQLWIEYAQASGIHAPQ